MKRTCPKLPPPCLLRCGGAKGPSGVIRPPFLPSAYLRYCFRVFPLDLTSCSGVRGILIYNRIGLGDLRFSLEPKLLAISARRACSLPKFISAASDAFATICIHGDYLRRSKRRGIGLVPYATA